jgi:hypothetical protein
MNVFIVGHRKSGSTWLLNLLSLHPDVRGVMETNIFHLARTEPDPAVRTERLFSTTPFGAGGLWRWAPHHLQRLAAPALRARKPALALAREERPATAHDLPLVAGLRLRRALAATPSPEAYVRTFFAGVERELRPPRYLLEKSPGNVRNLELITQLFPGARLLSIHRDGRDVVVSDRFFTRDHLRQDFDYAQAVRRWRADIEAYLAWSDRVPLLAVSYERLREDGPAVVGELLDFLDLPRDPALVERMLERSSFRFYAGRDPGTEDRKRFYRKGVVGDWRNHLDEGDRRVFKEIAGDLLMDLGYEKSTAW